MVFKQTDRHRRMRGNSPPAKSTNVFCFMLFWCFYAWSGRESEELLTQRWHLKRALSDCSFAPSLLPCVYFCSHFPSLNIALTNPLHCLYSDVRSSQISELIKAAATPRSSINEVALFKRMKLAQSCGPTTSHRSSSTMKSALSCLKWASSHFTRWAHVFIWVLLRKKLEIPWSEHSGLGCSATVTCNKHSSRSEKDYVW